MADWNASLYLTFEDERTRPARDLLARVPSHLARRVVDLGCGPGNSTGLLAERFPGADILGLDMSDDMLAEARRRLPSVRFEKADVGTWQPAEPIDLIFANAVLQWLGDHARLMPRLMRFLAPGGVLAVQMPDNLDEPSHSLMRETAREGPWAGALAEATVARERLLAPRAYYDVLAPFADRVDIWRTEYQHPLADHDAISTWLRATGLKPFLDPLAPAHQISFLAAYKQRLEGAYRRLVDGRVLLAFPRLFIVARRTGRT